MANKHDLERVNVHLTHWQRAELRKLSRSSGERVASLIRAAINHYLDEQSRTYAIKEARQ